MANDLELPRDTVVREMMKGFRSIEALFADATLTFRQRLKMRTMVSAALLLKYSYQPANRLLGRMSNVFEEVQDATCDRIETRGTSCQEKDGGHYLTKEEVRQFQRSGILGPFEVITSSEATQLRHEADELHVSDFGGKILVGDDATKIMRRHGLWSINYSGLFQATRYPQFWDLLAAPQITHRIASLLGEDLLCWRSQFFEKKPGSGGTFWHQSSTFRENSIKPKLQPTIKTHASGVQLTAWIALSDSTIKNGCMRFMPGSFTDGRYERMAYNIIDSKLDYLLNLSHKRIEEVIWALNFTPGNFVKAQVLLELALDEMPDLFEGGSVQDIEMKAGQAVVFTSLNMHASYPNQSESDTRLALAGRYTTNAVRVYPDFDHDTFATPEGYIPFNLNNIGCMQVHGSDHYGHNRILNRPTGISSKV